MDRCSPGYSAYPCVSGAVTTDPHELLEADVSAKSERGKIVASRQSTLNQRREEMASIMQPNHSSSTATLGRQDDRVGSIVTRAVHQPCGLKNLSSLSPFYTSWLRYVQRWVPAMPGPPIWLSHEHLLAWDSCIPHCGCGKGIPPVLSGLHRCVHDLLPNGRMLLVDGNECGITGILHCIGEGNPHRHPPRHLKKQPADIPDGIGSD